MILPFRFVAILALSSLAECRSAEEPRYRVGRARRVIIRGSSRDLGSAAIEARHGETCLAAGAIQTASTFTGQEEGTTGIKPGQANSATDAANFINYCSGKTLTNGRQVQSGSCNGIPMGMIPSTSNMISSLILSPQFGTTVPANKTFNITVKTTNLRAGYLVNPTTNYYTAPQELDEDGHIIGHCHVVVQKLGDGDKPPSATEFAFFKGIDDAGDGEGLLSTQLEGGLPEGLYRVCTMIAARNHQPVTMPVAQRGAQDDCTKFVVA
ncbi:hypothetical protein QBC37DRAFT_428578 [Rhypophila decipiens]|uniref:Uncharacterized protein n=1 Tax=Rhypophila decipiens TaxID=261697 RepID=A0AAN6Y1H8_9PEZI|nr:hypothetical protein QBC37DRAFT_428578 [Rhypophila decipiens]